METNKDEPEKIIIDLDGAIEKIINKKFLKEKRKEGNFEEQEEQILLKNELLGLTCALSSSKTSVKKLLKLGQENMLWQIKNTPTKIPPGYT